MFKKVLSLVLVLVLCFSMSLALASCGKDDEKPFTKTQTGLTTTDLIPEVTLDTTGFGDLSNFKIGVILLHDEDSTYDANFINSVKRVQTALGLTDSQVILKKNIGETDDCTVAADELANQGCKIIFADSFGHESFLLESAKKTGHENIQYCHATGTMAHTEGQANFHNAFASIYEGRFLAGIAAGLKLNEMKALGQLKGDVPMIGYVGAFTYAEVVSGYTAFYLGAKSVCPDVQMKVQFTGSWYDEQEEKDAANTLINAGCDLISQHADSMGAPTACRDAGVPNISYNGSTYTNNEESFIISSRIDWAPYFLYIIKQVSNSQAIDTDWTGTIATGSVLLTALNQGVAAEGTANIIAWAIEALKNGTLKVFDTNTFTVKGAKVSSYLADVDTDKNYTPDTEVIANGEFQESAEGKRSAPYFDLAIDGIERLNVKF